VCKKYNIAIRKNQAQFFLVSTRAQFFWFPSVLNFSGSIRVNLQGTTPEFLVLSAPIRVNPSEKAFAFPITAMIRKNQAQFFLVSTRAQFPGSIRAQFFWFRHV
jgi:hypothetical protein